MMENESAATQLEAMRQGDLKSATLVESSLVRIGEINPTFNAVVTLVETRAREEAEYWDQARMNGHNLPPLAGRRAGL